MLAKVEEKWFFIYELNLEGMPLHEVSSEVDFVDKIYSPFFYHLFVKKQMEFLEWEVGVFLS